VGTPASVVLRRRLEWSETDPMDRWHYSAVFRFVDAAEMLLHHRLGIEHEAFPRMPRLNVTADFLGPLHYGQVADVHLAVEHIGRSSLRYAFTIIRQGTPLARGTMTVVWFDPETGRGAPWPEHLRKLLLESGPLLPGSCGCATGNSEICPLC
jgi:acyl-CoA thioester hydrolase